MEPQVIEITSEETLSIRHQVMWPHQTIDYVRVANDQTGKHFGLFLNNTMVSVISLFIVGKEAQFRKFATLKEYQGKGYGTRLLQEVLTIVKQHQLDRLWCNARIEKCEYYARFGMQLTDKKFVKGVIEYVIMEKILD
ncbi:GNAT family N-acetyltransferase [Carboxylicivirga sp. M1479]|uniref:GNAT family N-acetyltransferase n=1 Tax=Carboxylicivirga sp. M1479 TaxID=2594476 RepID=UPI001C8F2503|nr:GNAT family N-acetyltransferase [Carboxylicivirga sp. M1479]